MQYRVDSMTDDEVTDIAARIAARAAGEQSFSERMYCIAVGIRILVRAFEDMRAAGLDDSAIPRLLRYAVEEDKHAIEEFEE
jgi:hypothetical protein